MDNNTNLDESTKEEVDDMAVFAKPANFSFQISESKSVEFMKNDTKPAFQKAIDKFKQHGGKTTASK